MATAQLSTRRIPLARRLGILAAALALGLPGLAAAQQASPPIDSDLVQPGATATPAPPPTYQDPTAQPRYQDVPAPPPVQQPGPTPLPTATGCGRGPGYSAGATYKQEDIITAAEGVFGKGAEGLAIMVRDILRKQGEPNGYIAGREASAAIAIGLRYGSGMMCSKVAPRMPVYWTGPSIGFDFGGNAAKTFVLVYNLREQDDLFHRFVAGEGQAYLVGGFHVSYLRRGNVVLIPVRMGVGLRLGVNGGYMKITRKLNYLPF